MLQQIIDKINSTSQTPDLSDCVIYDYADYSSEETIRVGDLVHDGGETGAAFVYAIGSDTVTFLHNGSLIVVDKAEAESVSLVARFSISQNEARLVAVAAAALA